MTRMPDVSEIPVRDWERAFRSREGLERPDVPSIDQLLRVNEILERNAPGEPIENKKEGDRREAEYRDVLKRLYPEEEGYKILEQRELVDKDGNPVVDPVTGEKRRLDFVVVDKNGKVVACVEVTSPSAPKVAQFAKEERIRDAGGTRVRDPETGELYDVSGVPTDVERRV